MRLFFEQDGRASEGCRRFIYSDGWILCESGTRVAFFALPIMSMLDSLRQFELLQMPFLVWILCHEIAVFLYLIPLRSSEIDMNPVAPS